MPDDNSLFDILRRQRAVLVVFLCVVLLAVGNWFLQPEQAMRWLRAIVALPAMYLAMSLIHTSTQPSHQSTDTGEDLATTRYFASATTLIVGAVGFWLTVNLALQMWVKLGNRSGDIEFERRLLGLASCVVFVVVGNTLPKILTPLSILPRAQAAVVTVARRFLGTTLVLIGLASTLAYLTAPLAIAKTVFTGATIVAMLTTLGVIIWMNLAALRKE